MLRDVPYDRVMKPTTETLTMYGAPSTSEPLEWIWVERQLERAGAYWIVPAGDPPHPRPVWGVWAGDRLHLSVGSPEIARRLQDRADVVVHLGSSTDVVIVDGIVTGWTTDADLVAAYDTKYDWSYTVDEYGPLTTIAPTRIVAWHSAGWAGREGFRATGRWRFDPS